MAGEPSQIAALPPPPSAPSPPAGATTGGAPPQGKPLTPEDWANLVETFGPVGKWLGEQWRWKVEKDAEENKRAAEHSFRVILSLMGFLAGIIAVMSVLTYYGRVSGDALLFLVGTVSGVTLVMIQRYLFESEPDDSSSLL
ncbi:MAG: hypothetical protein L3K16_06625 [Thermoplasmata archaeon]|nr:hypothetical protein [Thermoplasmata archaeon]